MISFKCQTCLRPWQDAATFSVRILPTERLRCPYCGSKDIRKVIP